MSCISAGTSETYCEVLLNQLEEDINEKRSDLLAIPTDVHFSQLKYFDC